MANHWMSPPFASAQNWPQQASDPSDPFAPTQLNPDIPDFQPKGTEMQRYQFLPAATPPATSMAQTDVLQLRNMMLDNHYRDSRDISRLERKMRQNRDAIEEIRETACNDLRILQNQIQELKQGSGTTVKHTKAVAAHAPTSPSGLAPPREFFDSFSNERIAEVYIEEAEDCEKTAARLRAQAEKLCGDFQPKKDSAIKMPAHPNHVQASEAQSDFICCGTSFRSVPALLEHLGEVHNEQLRQHQEESVCGKEPTGVANVDGTPTHAPPHRVRPAKGANSNKTNISDPDTVRPTREDTSGATRTGDEEAAGEAADAQKLTTWVPLAIRQMPPTKTVAATNAEAFSFDFLRLNFSGKEWSPGFYYIGPHAIFKSQSYWILEDDFEPFLPSAPGHHGAKLTAFFNSTLDGDEPGPDEKNYINVPLFIRTKDGPSGEYVYYGNYSQRRFSDKLDFDHCLNHVSEEVRRHHASELASAGRPQWLSNELKHHFWPMPKYTGPTPTDSRVSTPLTEASTHNTTTNIAMPEKRVMEALIAYAEELKEWDQDSKMRLSHLTEASLMKAFQSADEDVEPGLRLYFEYLQFEQYDQKFYDFMVELKKNPKLQGDFHENRGRRTERKPRVGGKMVKPKNGVETVQPAAAMTDASTIKAVEPLKLTPTPTPKAAVKTSKPHPSAGSSKPRQRAEDNAAVSSMMGGGAKGQMTSGDIDMAKQLRDEFQKKASNQRGMGGNDNDKKTPPHLRSNQVFW